MTGTRSAILLIDDELSCAAPSKFSAGVLEKLRKYVAAADCDLIIPKSKSEALAAPGPALLILDIDLSTNGWGAGYTGFKFWAARSDLRSVPLIVLSTQPPKTNFFAQKKARVIWIPKREFLEGDSEFLVNQVRSMATDIDNRRLDVILDIASHSLEVREGKTLIAILELQDPHVPSDAPFSPAMSVDGIRFHLIRMLMERGQVRSSILKSVFGRESTEQQKFLAELNAVIRQITKGRVGYKFIVNENRNLKLKARNNPLTRHPGQILNDLPKPPPVDDILRIEGLIKSLEERVSKLEGRGVKGLPAQKSKPERR